MGKKAKISYREIFGYLLTGLSVIMLGKSLMLCFSNDIWYDELFTVGMIEHSYGGLIAFTARDVHPPLYYCVVKFAVELCKLITPAADPVIISKTVSILPYFILLIYSVTLIRKQFGIFTGGVFLFCVISMPQLSAYTVEVRMYSFALLFVTAAFLHAYAFVSDQSHNMTALVLYGLAAAYTQYFACVAVIMVYLYILVIFLIRDRRRIRQWLVCVAISIAGYAPWLYALYTQITTVGEEYWILPLTWRTLGGCVKFVMKPAFTSNVLGTILAIVLFGICASIFLWNGAKLYHNRRENEALFIIAGLGVLAGTVLFGFMVSILFRPIFVYRYMIPALGCFWLGFAAGLDMIAKVLYKGFTVVICALVLLVGLRDYQAFAGEEEYKIVLMKDTVEAFGGLGTEDILIFNFDQVQMVTGYYLDNDSYLWYGQPEELVQEICGHKESLNEDVEQIREWLSQGRNVLFIGSFNSREDIVEEWRAAGITAEVTGSCLLERYWFNLYSLSLNE